MVSSLGQLDPVAAITAFVVVFLISTALRLVPAVWTVVIVLAAGAMTAGGWNFGFDGLVLLIGETMKMFGERAPSVQVGTTTAFGLALLITFIQKGLKRR